MGLAEEDGCRESLIRLAVAAAEKQAPSLARERVEDLEDEVLELQARVAHLTEQVLPDHSLFAHYCPFAQRALRVA